MIHNKSALSKNRNQSKKKVQPQEILVRDCNSNLRGQYSYPLWVPQNIDLDELLQLYPVGIPNAKEYLYYLMHTVYATPAFSKNVDLQQTNGFTILNGSYLQNVVDNYAPLLKWLVDRGILLTNNHYVVGQKSKGYKFTEQYRVDLKKVYVYNKPLVKKLIHKHWKKRLDKKKITLQPQYLYTGNFPPVFPNYLTYPQLARIKYHYLFKWFNEAFEIDYSSSINYLVGLKSQEIIKIGDEHAYHNYTCRKMVLDRLMELSADWAFVDDTTGRLHSPFTYLLTGLRDFIRFQGKVLVACDIKNSQPLLSLCFLSHELFLKSNIGEKLKIFNPKTYNNSASPSTCSMLGDFIFENQNNLDVRLYKFLVRTGRIYEYFGQKLRHIGIDVGEDERKFAKRQLFRAFFDKNNVIGLKGADSLRLFQKCFPTVFHIFSLIKVGRYQALACILQNIEADLVLNDTCKDIAKIDDKILLLTIHDSVVTTEDNYEIVERVLKSKLDELLGFSVTVKKEVWLKDTFVERGNSSPLVIPITQASENSSHPTLIARYGFGEVEHAIRPKFHSVRVAAKLLGLRSNQQLYKILCSLKIVQKVERNYRAEPIYIALGYFSYTNVSKNGFEIRVLRISNKGIDFIKDNLKLIE